MSTWMLIVAIVFAVVFVWWVAKKEVQNTRRYCEYLASEWRARAENETTQTRQYYCYWAADMIERAATIDDAARIDAEARKELKL
jgi:hypothetical protein